MTEPTLDPTGAANRLLQQKVNAPGLCLRAVSGALRNGLPVLDNSFTAKEEWDKSIHFTGYPPVNYPGYFSGAGGDWDVCLYAGSGEWVATDGDGMGRIGVQTTAEREAQVGGTYQGFTRQMAGYQLVTPNPILKEIENMDSPFGICTGPTTANPTQWAVVSADLSRAVVLDSVSKTGVANSLNARQKGTISYGYVSPTDFAAFTTGR